MKRLNYTDGLKGWCMASVCILRFLLMFVIGGFVGWKCLPEAALISVIVSYTFSKNKKEDKLKQKIMMCYFRVLLWFDLPLAMIMFCTKYLISQ